MSYVADRRRTSRGVYQPRPKFAAATEGKAFQFTCRREVVIFVADALKRGAKVEAWRLEA